METVIVGALQRCRLCAGLNDAALADLAKQCVLKTYAAGTLLCAEGEPGRALFILDSGVLEVFTELADDTKIVLSRLDGRGQYVGEQAVRRQQETLRSASVGAVGEARVVVIDKAVFQDALARDPLLHETLESEGTRQLKQLSLVQVSAMYRALVAFDEAQGWSHEEHFEDGAEVFRQGEPAERVYVIRRGEATVSRQRDDGSRETLVVLRAGQPFGELGVMERAPRRATVTARGALDVVSFDGRRFLRAAAVLPELHDYMSALKRIYAFGRRGVVTQFDGHFLDAPALVTVFHLDDGTTAIANHLVEQAIYSATVRLNPNIDMDEYEYDDPRRRLRRRIGLHQGSLVRVFAQGPWNELGRVHRCLLEHTAIGEEQLRGFTATGSLFGKTLGEAMELEQILCHCLQVTRGAVERCVAGGGDTLGALARDLGVTTVCGGCTGSMMALVGDADGIRVRLVEEIPVLADVRSFRFAPMGGEGAAVHLLPARPGQHVVVSTKIDGRWVSRPYTLTSPAHEMAHREITVKLEPHGYFSHWMFERRPVGAEFWLSHPQGGFQADLERPEPIVCLVAGIGMTPALAIARSVVASHSGQALHIDYSARFEQAFAYRAELEALVENNANISMTLRATAGGARITKADLEHYQQRFDRARYFICGPDAYQHAIAQDLCAIGVPSEAINVEVFTPVGHPASEQTAPRSRADNVWLAVSVLLFGAYLLQAALGWNWPWLERLQDNETYRLWSGGILLAYIALQWYLPWLRLSGQLRRAATFYPWHKYLGALAPVVFYLHSTHFGYGYLFALAAVYIANVIVGALDKTVIRDAERREHYARGWLVTHVVLSMLTVSLALFHTYVVFAY